MNLVAYNPEGFQKDYGQIASYSSGDKAMIQFPGFYTIFRGGNDKIGNSCPMKDTIKIRKKRCIKKDI